MDIILADNCGFIIFMNGLLYQRKDKFIMLFQKPHLLKRANKLDSCIYTQYENFDSYKVTII